VGQYNAAYRLFEAPLFIIEAVKTTFFPAASDFYIQDRSELKRLTVQLFEKATAFGISIAVVTALVSVDLITLLYGPAYRSAGALLSVLIIGVAMIMPGSVCGTTLRAADRQRISAVVTGAGALFNILLNFALIPAYAALGAAWATVATEGFVLMLHTVILWRLVGPLFSRSFLWRMVLLGVLWVSAIMVTRPLGVVPQILAACLLFFPFLIVCRVFTLDQMNNLMLLRTFRLKLKRDCWSKKRL
jgi:O-antigen/teichoic acid export membrane protein